MQGALPVVIGDNDGCLRGLGMHVGDKVEDLHPARQTRIEENDVGIHLVERSLELVGGRCDGDLKEMLISIERGIVAHTDEYMRKRCPILQHFIRLALALV